ncbi:WYL domain-containing protein [Leifsonia sp. NPDC080035]|uniref:WYL domain-containing protein n=1 Tax=Leifsonia sp. NPDC080035 TaxID=3143936 RepID=A0AAU7GA41_9MICO
MNRTDRLYALREELRRAGSAGRSAEQLAARFEVSARTVKRDISSLQQGGFPVWARPGRGGGYTVDAEATLPPVNFTAAEASGLAAAVAAHRGQPFDADARAALGKVLAAMPGAARRRASATAARIWLDQQERPGDAHVRRAVEQALHESRVLTVRYRDADGALTTREVDPAFLARADGAWYLVGHCRLRDAIRWFRIDRIASANVTSRAAAPVPVAAAGTPPDTARPVDPAL